MNLIQLQGALELGLIYSLVSLGVYLSFRTLQFSDLTVDGTFPLGAAICAALISHGFNPYGATLMAILGGALFELITAILSAQLKNLSLLAGILNMSALYSINLRIMGNRPNLSLLGVSTVFTPISEWVPANLPVVLITLALITLLISTLLHRFLVSEMGLALRAVGSNSRMAKAQGIKDSTMNQIGLALSNGVVALAGALFAQIFGFADVSMGIGTIIIGLASVIMGESIFPNLTIRQALVGCIGGAILYRLMIASALNLGDAGLQASDLNLITAVLVLLAIFLKSSIRRKS